MSGSSASSNSGNISIQTENGGTMGPSGNLIMQTGNASSGGSGAVELTSGAGSSGKGGTISFSVGSSDIDAGGMIKMDAGLTSDANKIGGNIMINAGLSNSYWRKIFCNC